MPKQSKRTIKFLRKQSKASGPPVNKLRKKRLHSEADDLEIVDLDVDQRPISLKKDSFEAVEKSPKGSKGSFKKHRDELESLKIKDPEFYEYLEQNDANLLSFGGDDDDDDENDGENSDDDMSCGIEENGDSDIEEEKNDVADDALDRDNCSDDESMTPNQRKGKSTKASVVDVTEAILDDSMKRTLEGSFLAFKKLLSIFKAACLPTGNSGDEDDNQDGPLTSFTISSPDVYQQVMVGVTDHAHVAFYKLLDVDDITTEVLANIGAHPKWKKAQFLVLSFFRSVLHTLSSLAATAKQGGEVAVFVITGLEAYIPLLAPLPRLAKAVLNALLSLWAQGTQPADDDANVRVHAFLRIRQMALLLPGVIPEECFRSIYLKFARECKGFNEMNAPSVNFMAKCVTELYSSDPVQAYQQAFLYIRQLALHLRTAFLKKTSESTRQVTTWQFLNCLRLWTRIVCAMPGPDELGPLSFPLAQIMFGIMVTAPSSYFLPLRFHLISCLHQLAASTKSFIPTAARLVEIFENPDLFSKPAASTDAPPKLQYIVRLPPDSVHKVAVRDTLVVETINLLRQDTELYRYHVAFPEYTYSIIRKLKTFTKKAKVGKWRDLAKALANQLEQQAASVKKQRVKLGKAPMDIKEFEPLLPDGAPDAAARLGKLIASRTQAEVSEVSVTAHGHEGAPMRRVNKPSKGQSGQKVDKFHGDDDEASNLSEEKAAENIDEEVPVVVKRKKKHLLKKVAKMEDTVGKLDW